MKLQDFVRIPNGYLYENIEFGQVKGVVLKSDLPHWTLKMFSQDLATEASNEISLHFNRRTCIEFVGLIAKLFEDLMFEEEQLLLQDAQELSDLKTNISFIGINDRITQYSRVLSRIEALKAFRILLESEQCDLALGLLRKTLAQALGSNNMDLINQCGKAISDLAGEGKEPG